MGYQLKIDLHATILSFSILQIVIRSQRKKSQMSQYTCRNFRVFQIYLFAILTQLKELIYAKIKT